MFNKTNIKGIVAATILALGATSAAYANVSCPSAEDVKNADRALDTVMRQSEHGFFVLSARPSIQASGLGWMVATQSRADGFDAAYRAGQESVKSVMSGMMDQPIEQQGVYICPYITSSGGMNVMAVAQAQQGLVFNPAMLDMKNLRKQMKK